MSNPDRLSADETVLAARYADFISQERLVELASRRSLDRSPKSNWVEETGDLPGYIREIARALERDHGMPLSRAIPTAISRVKRWARGGGNVKADTRAKAAKAVAQWEALKAKNKARMAKKKD